MKSGAGWYCHSINSKGKEVTTYFLVFLRLRYREGQRSYQDNQTTWGLAVAVLLQRKSSLFRSFLLRSITVIGGDPNFTVLWTWGSRRDHVIFLPKSPIRVMTHIPTLLYTMGQGHELAADTPSSISRPPPMIFHSSSGPRTVWIPKHLCLHTRQHG